MEARLITNIKKTMAKEMEQSLKFLDGPETRLYSAGASMRAA